MRIDAHQHFWNYEPLRDAWITDEMSILRRNYCPEDLRSEMRASGFEGSIAVQADQSESETRFLLDLATRHPFIVGVVGWVDLAAPNIEERLTNFRSFEKLRGFRHIVQSEPDDQFLLRAEFRRGISCLSRFGFSYDILIYARQLPAAIKLAASHPDQRFVLDHIAKPEIKARKLEPWASQMRELAALPNVFCKLSGLVTEADWKDWKPDDCRPYLEIAWDCFSADRLMFGSDWPVCLLAGSYARSYSLVADFLADRLAEEQDKVFGINAARFYGVKSGGMGDAREHGSAA